MNSAGRVGKAPVIIVCVMALIAVIAVIVALIPFPTSGEGGPTTAFRAQQELDKVVFKFGETSGAKYSGSITYSYDETPSVPEQTIKFSNLVVTASSNAEGTVTQNDEEAQYRQIGNNVYANGTKQFWSKLLGRVPDGLDLDSVASKWADTDGSGMLWLGSFLSPRMLAGRLAIGDAPSGGLGQELDFPNKGLPDARFWPTSDPKVALNGNTITVGSMTTTFDEESKAITHIKGSSSSDGIKYRIDTDVSPITDNDRDKLFANERSFAPELTSVPAPGIAVKDTRPDFAPGGSCTTSRCEFPMDLHGTLVTDKHRTGYINYGITVTFANNDRPVGGSCTRVVRVDFGATARTQCDAVNLPSDLPNGARIKPVPKVAFLPFNTKSPADLSRIIDNNETASKKKITLARSGTKRPGSPTSFNYDITDMPSVYVVKQGDYQFDGFGPSGAFLVALSTGYEQHVVNGGFDPSWSGTTTLREQAAKQVAAAGGTEVVWFMAEEKAVPAARALLDAAGITDRQIIVYYSKPSE